MKSMIVIFSILAAFTAARAQERLSHDEALRYARAVTAEAGQLKGGPLPLNPDVAGAVALRDGEYGGLVLPEKGLSLDKLPQSEAGGTASLGVLWLYNLAPMRHGQAVYPEQLRLVDVYADGTSATVPQCALGVRRAEGGKLELCVYGKGPSPLLTVPLVPAGTGASESPLDLAAARDYGSGRITFKVLGKYEATVEVTELLL